MRGGGRYDGRRGGGIRLHRHHGVLVAAGQPGWFFKGAELEAWKRANPGAAADWEATLKRFGVD